MTVSERAKSGKKSLSPVLVKSGVRVTRYYAILKQRFAEYFGTTVTFSLTDVPSHLTVGVSESACTFVIVLAARLLLEAGGAEHLHAEMHGDGREIRLSLSGVPLRGDAFDAAVSKHAELFTRTAEKAGFRLETEKHESEVSFSFRLTVCAPDDHCRCETETLVRADAFAEAMAYPI